MAESCHLGTVEGMDGASIAVGIEDGAVALYFGAWQSADGVRLGEVDVEEFAQLYIAACWHARDPIRKLTRPGAGPGQEGTSCDT
jgi:hypothetical protein